MQKITFLFLLFYAVTQAQIVNFPDANLKDALVNHSPTIDTNNNGEIEVSEATNYNTYYLTLQSKGITDITGLENFTEVEEFRLSHNDISSIDISVLFWAKNLRLTGNDLTELNTSSNIALEELSISNNFISNLDLSNNENLLSLFAISTNLSTLDVSNNLLLEELFLWSTNISTLDLSSNNLKRINIAGTPFTTFDDFSTQTELEYINISSTDISTLDTSVFPNLTTLNIQTTDILDIDLSQNTALESLNLGYSNMTSIDISNNINLRDLRVYLGLTSLDISQNTELRSLRIINNSGISSLDLSTNTNLCYVSINNTSIEYINVKNGTNTNFDPNTTCSISSSGSGLGGIKFSAVNSNDNLAFICVDDIDYALENFEISDTVTLLDICSGNIGETNELTGIISYDESNNGCDPDDQPISAIVHSTDGVSNFATTSIITGDFSLQVFEGGYDTQVVGLPNYFTTDPILHQNTFTGFNQTENVNFCITSTETVNDLSVTLIPVSQARPGFESSYQIVYSNTGTTTLSGTVDLSFNDALVSLETSTPTPTSSTTNTLSWDYDNLAPFTSRTINFIMLVEQPPIVEGDDILQYTASISPNTDDQTPNDNTFELNQIVVNSFDPNDKRCLEGNQVLIENADEYLHYLIRFQNTGTASAINVRVADQLDEKLDWTTLVVESLSHPGRVEIENGQDVSFIFDDIHLPHEDEDSEGSNGFIAFKIKPIDGIILGDTIENTAYIFFDFNPPIITNTTTTTFVETLSVDDISTFNIEIYPNPVANILTINSATPIEKATIYNTLGQVVKTTTVNVHNSQIDMSTLQTGIYFIKITSITGLENIKQLVKK